MQVDTLAFIRHFDSETPATVLVDIKRHLSQFGRVYVYTTERPYVKLFVDKSLLDFPQTLVSLVDAAKFYGFKCQRVDICLDLPITLPRETLITRANGVFGLNSGKGETFYFGSRRSDAMWRVYDKRKEIERVKGVDIGFELTRYEVELKRRHAVAAWRVIANAVAREVFEYAGDADNEFYVKACGSVLRTFDNWELLPDRLSGYEKFEIPKTLKTKHDPLLVWLEKHRDDLARHIASDPNDTVLRVFVDIIDKAKEIEEQNKQTLVLCSARRILDEIHG